MQTIGTLGGLTVLTYTFDPIRPLIYYADRFTGDFVTLSRFTGLEVSRFMWDAALMVRTAMDVSNDGNWVFTRAYGGVVAVAIPSPSVSLTLTAAGSVLMVRRRRCLMCARKHLRSL